MSAFSHGYFLPKEWNVRQTPYIWVRNAMKFFSVFPLFAYQLFFTVILIGKYALVFLKILDQSVGD